VIVLFTDHGEGGGELKASLRRISSKYPSVKVKVINVKKEPLKVAHHRVESFPTVLLLKDGREVDRLTKEQKSPTLLEQLFRKAHV
jgi:thioredoxin-like negative regulator of GroEL